MNWTQNTDDINSWVNQSVYGGMSTQGEGIDLRLEMNQLLYGTPFSLPKGHWIILRTFDKNQKSEFYKPCTKEGVGGPAYPFTEQLVKTRHVPTGMSSDKLEQTKAGALDVDSRTYYFEYFLKLNIGDYIYELDWDDHRLRPTIGQVIRLSKYLIKRVNPNRMENGNIQFYSVLAEHEDIRN